ncbi:UNVERIFIED_CONTAM: Peptide chain release factor PrfB2, chloroplastic [Sesamum calycinum]|uniref:Peptide chain release factor PrfB2, chloroplastic n=1 Tax=Sesamum calycinum TaxID=2727403 RepID=A0AAW2R6R1_9LAMI
MSMLLELGVLLSTLRAAIGRSPVFSLKEIGPESLSPIGLKLKNTFLSKLLENRLSRPSREDNEGGSIRDRPRRRTANVGPQPTSEKLKASNFPIKYIRIGNWERISEHEGHLVAKLYYAKKKMVWEILVRELKNKIEMQWSDISAIRVSMHDNEDGILQIQISSDFTQGQASIFRIHTIVFPPGVLNSHYEKLLSCDRRLLELSQQPFPSQESPYFDLPSLSGDSTLTVTGNEYRSSSASPVLQYSHQPHHKMQVRATPSGPTPSPSTTVLNFPLQNELPRKKAMNGLLSPPPPPPPTPNDPIVMGPEVNNVVPSLMPNNPADVVLYRFMPHGNPTNKWKKLIPRLEILSVQLNKPDLWDDPARAGKISREHGSIMVKMKEVNAFEQELFEHIDMIKLAREENDAELESVGTQFSLSRHRATIKVDGEYAFGYAKAEVGSHRLVRISPFDSNKRRHTSFASVAVIPILAMDFQHFKSMSLTYALSGFERAGLGLQISSVNRSQHQNKASAMAVLQSRLDQLEMETSAQINAEHTQSLNRHKFWQPNTPYRMVKDHRTDYEVSDPDTVLQGDLDGFILSYLSASLDKNEDEDP